MSAVMRGHCAGCGTVIYWQDRYEKRDSSEGWSTTVVAEWPPQIDYNIKVVRAYMATESGPDICHCYHCGRRFEGANLC